jgi:hypothetical protein
MWVITSRNGVGKYGVGKDGVRMEGGRLQHHSRPQQTRLDRLMGKKPHITMERTEIPRDLACTVASEHLLTHSLTPLILHPIRYRSVALATLNRNVVMSRQLT